MQEIRLVAVSKACPPQDVLEAALHGGQRDFGESYVQEALVKIEALKNMLPPGHTPLTWHFMGPLQANKTRLVAENFDWVHSIDRIKIAERLSSQRPEHLPPLQVCVQVNISGEPSKSGCDPDDTLALCHALSFLPGLCLRGLMAIPAPERHFENQCLPFARLRRLFETLRAEKGGAAFEKLDTLSMGMSHDFEAAICEGSTLVRLGTAIFGERESSVIQEGADGPH